MKKGYLKEFEVAGRKLRFEVNKVAPQAGASVIATYGETAVLVAVTMGEEKPMNDGGAPVTVDFIERLYAGGIIKGSRWVKREGRATDDAILTDRMIDRSIRPLFPKDFVNEVQIVVTLLSTDNSNDHDILSLNAVSLALAVSNIPWKGPVGAVRMGLMTSPEENFLVNPVTEEMNYSDLDLVVTSGKDGILMIEAGAKQIAEEEMAKAVEVADRENQKIVAAIEEIVKEVGAEKFAYDPKTLNAELTLDLERSYEKEIEELMKVGDKNGKVDGSKVAAFKEAVLEKYLDNPDRGQIPQILESLMKKSLRKTVLEKKTRIDGRKPTEVRSVSAEVGLLPRTHGSAIFKRGLTEVLSVVTLASPSLQQWIETAEGMEEKRYLHHYNAPPYSSGEVGRMGGLGRREIGHGALAERALEAVIPSQEDFPYTIRVVSEVLSQNGSSSMGSTCGSTLALMDAGVPLLAPVSGIAMGLVAEGPKDYVILSDLRGEEDFYGNMDFKIAGTEQGITAIQLDIKLGGKFLGLTLGMISEIFAQAKKGREEILTKMLDVIPQSRTKVSQYAPKVVTIQVPPEKIGEVIGPGGKVIRNIIATTGAAVDIDDFGKVTISSVNSEAVDKAQNWIAGMTREITVGEEFEGEVKRILNFGAFVEFLPGKEGLVHVSRMRSGFVASPDEVVKLGDKVKVRVVKVDEMGRIDLAMFWGEKDPAAFGEAAPRREFPGARFGGDRGGRGSFGPRRSGFGGRGGGR